MRLLTGAALALLALTARAETTLTLSECSQNAECRVELVGPGDVTLTLEGGAVVDWVAYTGPANADWVLPELGGNADRLESASITLTAPLVARLDIDGTMTGGTVTAGGVSAALEPTADGWTATVADPIGTGAVDLWWTAPTENEDGTPLTDLAGYVIYYGTAPGSYPNSLRLEDPSLLRYTVEGLAPGTWYFVASAFNADGVEGMTTNEVHATVEAGQTVPAAPAWNAPGEPDILIEVPAPVRIEDFEWTCRDSAGSVVSQHRRQDTAIVSCQNHALAQPGDVFEVRPSGYRVVAQ